MNSRKTPNFTSAGSIVGTSRVRITSANFPSAVARGNTRSVGLTRRCAKAMGESDALGFVTVQQRVGRAAGKNRLQFPGEIDRIADARIHTLSAGGAMDERGVAKQEGAALPEILRHAVVDVIGREPVHCLDLDLEIVDDPPADILEFERIGMLGAF